MLIKRAALGNLKASFHCTHWHRFFPLKKAFSKTYPSFLTVKEGFFLPLRLSCKESSTFTPSPSSSGSGDVTALLGARNRYALRLADQSGLRHIMRDGTAWGINNDGKTTSQMQRRHCSIPSLQKSWVVSYYFLFISIII